MAWYRGQLIQDRAGHIFDFHGHQHAAAGSGEDFLIAISGHEAIGEQVLLFRRVVLQGTEGTVMIGDHKAIG